MERILVIRGGAIGDFVLTLPAVKLLRDGWPHARLEILGYKHIVALAQDRFYADSTRSIEYAALASFFARSAELPAELTDYFAGFDLIVSYLFDPDEIFVTNLRRCSNAQLIVGSAKLAGHEHAARQLARPLEQLGLFLEHCSAELFPTEDDRAAGANFLPHPNKRLVAVHPGSGSATKNWPLGSWAVLGHELTRRNRLTHLIVVGGEADRAAIAHLQGAWQELSVSYIVCQQLPIVAAVIAACAVFIGHDSGISHIAAAVGTRCVLLFGPTDPAVWAPMNTGVRVIRPPTANLNDISIEHVLDAIATVPTRS